MARTELPLKKQNLESLSFQMNQLHRAVAEHSHSFIGSGSQPSEIITGFLRSSDYKSGSSGWMIGANNNCEFNDGIFRGTLYASAGDIGGWDILTGYIYNLQSGTPTATPNDGLVLASGNAGITCYEDTAKRLELGYLSSGVYGLRIYDTGGSNVIFETSDTLQQIAGWHFTQTTLADNATANNANVLIDSGNSLIRLGATSGNYLTLDGGNQKIESSNYVSGYAGAGFHLSSDLLEVGNIACRGIIRTAVFQKDVISVVGGNIAVLDGDVLDANMDATDAETLTIEGNTTFAVNDILRIKDGTDDEWLTVTNIGSAPTYTVTRDRGSDYGSNANPTWKKGATIVNYGASGSGGIYMTASENNAPYLSVFTHAGSPWTTINTRLRIGNLNGYLGYSTDLYGIGIGDTTHYLKYDPTNHLRIRGSITSSTITGGIIQTATSGERTVITGNDIYFYDDTTGGTDVPNKVITGNAANIYFPRTDDATQRCVIRKRSSYLHDDHNVLEQFFDKDANNSKYNYFFNGRMGNEDPNEGHLVYNVHSTLDRFDIDCGNSNARQFVMCKSDTPTDAVMGNGDAGGVRTFYAFHDMGTPMVFTGDPDFTLLGMITGGTSGATGYIGVKTDTNNYIVISILGTFSNGETVTEGAHSGTLSSWTSREFDVSDFSGGAMLILGHTASYTGGSALVSQMWLDAYRIWIDTDIFPYTNNAYSLGDTTHQFKELWTKEIVSETIQTASSGERMRMIANAGSTPSQFANSFALINSSGDILLSFGTSTSAVQEITPATNRHGLNIINKTGTSYASDLLYLQIVGAGSSGENLAIANAGTGHCIKLTNTGTGGHLEFIPKATFTSSLSEGLCYADTDHHLKYYNGSDWLNLDANSISNAQIFTSNGTWTKPAGATFVRVVCIGGGGGGGGDHSDSNSGGGGGAIEEKFFKASDLGATETILIGAGGTGGNQSAGGAGGTSSFGTYLYVYGGGGGRRGQGSGGSGGGTGGVGEEGNTAADSLGGVPATTAGTDGISGQGAGGENNEDGKSAEYGGGAGGAYFSDKGGSSLFGAGGGGGGGYQTGNGGEGGGVGSYVAGGGGAGGTSGSPGGTAGTNCTSTKCGTGGGGGYGGTGGIGGAGGAGGGGGGGGGNNKDGGAGGRGEVRVYTF